MKGESLSVCFFCLLIKKGVSPLEIEVVMGIVKEREVRSNGQIKKTVRRKVCNNTKT